MENFFRREYAKLVAVLSRRVNVQHLESVEDAVQSAMLTALESWTAGSLPTNPSAWLYRVASNNLLGALRKQAGQVRLLSQRADELCHANVSVPEYYLAGELGDDLLRMLFVCCDPAISVESQLVLSLKILCGFSVGEISHRLFASEANIYKRLSRGRKHLREISGRADTGLSGLTESGGSVDPTRLAAVHRVLYLLFTEGYLSSHAELSIRIELCEEALHLAHILAGHQSAAEPETYALLALMHLHLARMTTRQNLSGALLLLEEQDRQQWDQRRIGLGLHWLERSSTGERFSRYHAEAGIAAEHCLAPSFRETCWERIVECYLLLEQSTLSPLHRLNRALALAEWQGPRAGLAILLDYKPASWLEGSYLWAAVMADLLRRTNDPDAESYAERALKTAPNRAIRTALKRRFESQSLQART